MGVTSPDSRLPLEGTRVIDLGHALAGPFAATMLGDFGAEVLKIEKPGTGDAMRNLGPRKAGVPLWWAAAARNKKSVTLDFTTPAGRDLLLDMLRLSDVLVENFRPGTMERYGLGPDELRDANPRLVMVRISGFGQTGPDRARPGFGRIAEAMSGASQLTGERDGPPGHVGYSLADTLSGLMGAFGALVCLLNRNATNEGDCVDLALYEPLFRLIDWQVIVYEQLGIVPERNGPNFPSVLEGVSAGVVQSIDGVWMSYSAATDNVMQRLIRLALGEEALTEPRFADVAARRRNTIEVQRAVEQWMSARTEDEIARGFLDCDAVAGRVYDVSDIWADDGYRARGNIITVEDQDLGEVAMHGVIPHIREHGGRVASTGPALGQHTDEVLSTWLGLSGDQIVDLRKRRVI